jgi:hypothetical protein
MTLTVVYAAGSVSAKYYLGLRAGEVHKSKSDALLFIILCIFVLLLYSQNKSQSIRMDLI